MLMVKILLPIATLLIAFIEIGLETRWKEEGTRGRKTVRFALLALLLVTTGFTIVVLVADEKSANKREAMLERQEVALADIKGQLEVQRELANKAEEREQEITSQLKEVVVLAKSKYPGRPDMQAITSLLKQYSNMEQQLASHTNQLAPPSLSIELGEFNVGNSGTSGFFFLVPSNNMPIGEIKLAITIAGTSGAHIVSLGPTGANRNVSTWVSEDKTKATLSYLPTAGERQRVQFSLDRPSKILLSGSHGIGSLEIGVGVQ